MRQFIGQNMTGRTGNAGGTDKCSSEGKAEEGAVKGSDNDGMDSGEGIDEKTAERGNASDEST